MRNRPIHALSLAAALLAPCAGNIFAQVATAYDYAKITPANQNVGRLLELSNDTIAAAQITLLDLLKLEYPFLQDRIRGLTPQQLTTRFDVVAKIDPPGVADPVHNPKAQTFAVDALLKNHFHLKAHEASVDITSEQMIALPDNTKLTPLPPRCRPCSRTTVVTSSHLKSDRISMSALADQLSKALGVEISDRTKLQGNYAVDLNWSPGPGASTQPPEDLLRNALESQLGLTLVPSHRKELAIIIDYIDLPANVLWLPPNSDSAQTALSSR